MSSVAARFRPLRSRPEESPDRSDPERDLPADELRDRVRWERVRADSAEAMLQAALVRVQELERDHLILEQADAPRREAAALLADARRRARGMVAVAEAAARRRAQSTAGEIARLEAVRDDLLDELHRLHLLLAAEVELPAPAGEPDPPS